MRMERRGLRLRRAWGVNFFLGGVFLVKGSFGNFVWCVRERVTHSWLPFMARHQRLDTPHRAGRLLFSAPVHVSSLLSHIDASSLSLVSPLLVR